MNSQPDPRLMFSRSIPRKADSNSRQPVSIAGYSRNCVAASDCIESRSRPISNIMSADRRSRTFPPIAGNLRQSARQAVGPLGIASSSEMQFLLKLSAVAGPSSPFGSLL